MKDNDTISSGVNSTNGWSVITFPALKNTTVTCNARDQDGVTSKHATLTVIGTCTYQLKTKNILTLTNCKKIINSELELGSITRLKANFVLEVL